MKDIYTTYQLWKILKIFFTKDEQIRKRKQKGKLGNIKFDEEDDINIFMVELKQIIYDKNLSIALLMFFNIKIIGKNVPFMWKT